jgi:cystathionine gamma-synthase
VNGLQHFPLGRRLPGSIHSVGVSLPTVADVRGYEEKRPETLAVVTTGYPRFIEHPYIGRLRTHLQDKWAVSDRLLAFVSTLAAASDLLQFTGAGDARVRDLGMFAAVELPLDHEVVNRATAYLQHTGAGISSRAAEDALVAAGLLDEREAENAIESGAAEYCKDKLRLLYELESEDSILLCNSGMNAIYALYTVISKRQEARGRDVWIQLGWLYVDSIFVLEKFAGREGPRIFLDVFDLDAVGDYLDEHGKNVAGIITEVPTNPLMQTCDLPRLSSLARAHDIPVVVDPTMSSPHNVSVLPYADFVVNSLTKYAASEGDVLGGALVGNPQSPFCKEILKSVAEARIRPYKRDLGRLAWEMRNYEDVADTMNANAEALVAFLQGRRNVRHVYWAGESRSKENYQKIARRPNAPGCVLTVVLNCPLADVYDRARMAKSPSFGTTFTILSPYMYLAHYDCVVDREKSEFLRSHEIDPDLLRISVGTEPAEDILEAFGEVF